MYTSFSDLSTSCEADHIQGQRLDHLSTVLRIDAIKVSLKIAVLLFRQQERWRQQSAAPLFEHNHSLA
jgi:hypothetical protein